MKQALLPSNRSITVAARIDRPAGGHPEQSEGSAFHPDSLPPRCHPDPALAGKGSAFARLLTRAARIDCPAGGHPERSEGSAFHSDARPPKPWHRRGWLLSFARLLTRAARILTLSRAQRGICFISLLLTFHSPLVTVVSAQGITPQSIITTVAGGSWQFRGDGGPAIDAPLGTIQGVAVDSAGNVYVADPDNFLILKISPDGILTIVAGNGLLGFSGDGGPATSASLPVPVGVALDAAGSLYIATLRRIHKVSADGIITTVAGNGEDGFSGDGGPATSATFDTISGVAVDTSGNLYIADSHNQRIRKVGLDGIITTVAGSGDTGYFNGGFSGDNGPATSALLSQPADVAVDAAGNLYIADEQNDRIRKVGLDGIITTVVGGAFPAMAFRPQVLLLIDPAGWR